MVICLDLHMAQLMPLPLTVSCFSKIQTGLTFLVLAHPGSPGKRAVMGVCVCVILAKLQHRLQHTLHNDRDHQMFIVGGPNMCPKNLRWPTAII